MPTTDANELRRLLSRLSAEGGSANPILELVLDSTGDGVAITDKTGDALYFNAAARKILGLGEHDRAIDVRTHGADLYYLHDFDPVPADDLPLVRALRGESSTDVQLFVRNPALADGALICLNARPIFGAAGEVVGGVAVFRDAGASKRAEDELRAANAKLNAWVGELERRARVMLLTNDMADLLQSCRTMDEFSAVVARFAASIFEDAAGAIFIANASHSAIEIAAEWGENPTRERVFSPNACWGLRRGRVHRAGGKALGPRCEHSSGAPEEGCLCVPMMGQGEALGVLHVREPSTPVGEGEIGASVTESRFRTVVSVAEHIALALANLKLRETLSMQAIRDPLTGLFNRRYMEESLGREMARAERASGSIAAVMIDIDHFKRFNDTFGHAAADLALRETATLIKARIRSEDIACRYGGEEIVLILPEATALLAERRAEAIRVAIAAQQLRYHGTPLGVLTASFGVAAYPPHGATPESLLRAADEALYQAKRSGRNRVVVREPPHEEPTTPSRSSRAPARLVSARVEEAG